MAVLGNYVVWCPMILGYYSEEHTPRAQGRDLLHKKALLSSRTLMGLEVAKLRRAVDYLSTLPEVDPRRIGMYGLSKGGHYLHALHGRPGEKAARGGGIRLVQRQDEKIDASEERRHTHALPHPH